ncbi:MAG: HAD-IA family hydrolase [Gemmatimonadota bacterium]
MSAPFRTILFDFDGTLVDSLELILSSFRHTLRIHTGSVPPDAAWLATMGTPLLAQLREFASDEGEVRQMMATYLRYNLEMHDAMIRAFPGVRETLEHIATDGYRLGIVSSKLSDGVRLGLRACGIPERLFSVIVAADDVDRHKPDAEPVRAALRRIGEAHPGRAIFVGDSVHDLQAGHAAGTFTAAALWGPFAPADLAPASPHYWLRRVEGLLDVLAGSVPVGLPAPAMENPDQELD